MPFDAAPDVAAEIQKSLAAAQAYRAVLHEHLSLIHI